MTRKTICHCSRLAASPFSDIAYQYSIYWDNSFFFARRPPLEGISWKELQTEDEDKMPAPTRTATPYMCVFYCAACHEQDKELQGCEIHPFNLMLSGKEAVFHRQNQTLITLPRCRTYSDVMIHNMHRIWVVVVVVSPRQIL